MTLPPAFTARMREMLGAEYDAFIASYDEPPRRALRVNTLRKSVSEFLSLAPSSWGLISTEIHPDGLIIGSEDGEREAGRHPYHAAGAYYMQEPSAMSVAAQLLDYDFGVNSTVLDMCAAPGGKTGAIAALMKGRGIIVANEIVKNRASELARNVERLGITNAVVTNTSPDKIADALPAYFDIVVVDAPCSGEGMFRKNPSACDEWSPEHVRSCAVRQMLILKSAALCVKPGGLLLYSTCTFSREENEDTVKSFAAECGFEILRTERLYPHSSDGEGHFVCVMRNSAGNVFVKAKKEKNAQKPLYVPCKSRVFADFMRDTFEKAPDFPAYIGQGGRVILCSPEMLDIAQKLPCVSCGVEAGYDKGGFFQPSHALFCAAFDCKYRLGIDFAPDDERLAAFMVGEEIKSPLPEGESGFCRISTDGFPVGFCKVTGGMLKNKLPKGLRMH